MASFNFLPTFSGFVSGLAVNPGNCQCTMSWLKYPFLSGVVTSTREGHGHQSTTAGQGHRCRFCNKQFARPCFVTQHERIHTGEKPYSCEICGKPFATKSNMTAHKNSHFKDNKHTQKRGKTLMFRNVNNLW